MPNLLSKQQVVYLGCDPEFFLSEDGEIVGSEKAIPEKGINGHEYYDNEIVRDGIQVEIHPLPSTCRQTLASYIHDCFKTMVNQLDKKYKIDFSQVAHITKKEMDSLSDKSKEFGCSPSLNIYEGESKIEVNASEYMKRSAGGHIHLGLSKHYFTKTLKNCVFKDFNPKIAAQLLDMVLGNTCVIIDRDESNIERRKIYGKAGEIRTPNCKIIDDKLVPDYNGDNYRIEYRTLSNFWLKSYVLMSLVFNLARLAIQIYRSELENKFIGKVDVEKIIYAINNNDLQTSLENWKVVREILMTILPENNLDSNYYRAAFPFDRSNMYLFDHFMSKPLEHWVKTDTNNIIKNWLSERYNQVGWEYFRDTIVFADYNKEKKKLEKKCNPEN
jgi:hypothetical protein